MNPAPAIRRMSYDCRDHQDTVTDCSVKISADTEDEVLKSAVQHVVSVHGTKDAPELRERIRLSIREDLTEV